MKMVRLNAQQSNIVQYTLLISLIYLVIFLKLGSFQMRLWDESMFAVNTFEMIENGHYFSLYFNGIPDLFNTKPPLTSWAQLLSVRIFGYNEFAIRFPSALAAAGSILLVFHFVRIHFTHSWAWIAALILLTSNGFIGFHTARAGDSDALLSFFILVANFNFITYLINEKQRHIFLFFIFLLLAFATKLYAALLFAPAYLFTLIYYKKLRAFIFNKAFWGGILLFVVSVISLILLRELETPGYLDQILLKDAARIYTVIEAHSEPFSYYFDNFFSTNFSVGMLFFIIGCTLLFSTSDKKQKLILVTSFCFVVSYLSIISLSVTKLEWYDMPLYPYLAIIAALAITEIVEKKFLTQTKQVLAIAVIFFYPYYLMFNKSQRNEISYSHRLDESTESYLFRAYKRGENLDGVKVLHHSWPGALLFYQYKFAADNQIINLTTTTLNLEAGDRVLVMNDSLKTVLDSQFKVVKLDELRLAELLELHVKIE